MRESKKSRVERAAEVYTLLEAEYPDAICALTHRNPYELAAATILSAQCTDERVNMVTGANLDDHHLRGVDVGRDIAISEWLDLRAVAAGESCPVCGEPLDGLAEAAAGGNALDVGERHVRVRVE